MAETVEVLNAKVVVDASSVTQAQSQFNAAVTSMASTYKGSFADKVKKLDEEMSQKFKELDADITRTEQKIASMSKTTDQTAKTMPSLHQQLRGIRSAFADVATVAGMVIGPMIAASQAFKVMQEAANFRETVQDAQNLASSLGVNLGEIMTALDETSNHTLSSQEKFKLLNDAMLRADDIVAEYADSMGISSEQVDSHTRQQLILNDALKAGIENFDVMGKGALTEADSFKQAEVAATEFIAVMKQLPTITGLVNDFTIGLQAGTQAIIMWSSWSKGAEAGYYARMSGQTEAMIKQAEAEARNEELRRLLPSVGIVPIGAQDEQTKLEEARLRRFDVQSDKANSDKLKKERTARDKMNDIIISSGEKARDSERSWMQDVIDLNIDHQQKLVEIALDGARKRQDIELDFARKIEDADLEYQQAIEEAQFQSASRRAEIEQRYQERLYQIQRRFQDSYWNAVKTRDAVALVEAVRERDRSIQDATRQRDQDIGSEDAQEQQRIQNAAIAHQRKLEDAQRYYERAMQDQRIAQQRAIEDENLEHQYREIELRRHFDWRIQEIDRAMNQELATAQVKYAQAQADYSNHLAQMASIAAAYMSQLGIGGASGGGGYTNPRTRRRQSGGVDLVNSPTPFLAGEGGPELVVTVPMGGNQQILPAPMSHTVSGDVRHQVDMIAANGMRGMEARIIAATMQALREVYRR